MKNNITAILFSLAIVIAAYLLGDSIINRNSGQGTISVTGLGNANFTSDLIVWEGSFSNSNLDLKKAYNDLEKDKKIIFNYLISKGVKNNEIVFKAVRSSKNTKAKYVNGKYAGEEFLGHRLTQSLQIDSKNVDGVEKISREITELLNKGIQFYSSTTKILLYKIS